MATRRSLGGGRVLGSGKSLAPPDTANLPSQTIKQPIRPTGLLSPSESSVSLSSHASSTPITSETEDLTARVALVGHGSAQAVAAASSRMVCPICSEEMMTLLQLNRHIDDNHANLEDVEQDEAKTWFKQQMVKAKKFQPLQLLNQKLRGLEVFESNNDLLSSNAPVVARDTRTQSPARPPPQEEAPVEPDDLITRAHWQRPRGHDTCGDPLCGKRLGPVNGFVNCRHCGKLFCDEHTMYQMKLSRSAQHEPTRGLWLTQLLANPPPPDQNQSASGFFWSSIQGNKAQIRALEQTIAPWEDDALVLQCPFCQQAFTQYTFRRHHCRTCGRVVCGDPETACSTEIGLDVDTRKCSFESSQHTILIDGSR
nr:vacuolar segregation protein pep7 [Quercus suber]